MTACFKKQEAILGAVREVAEMFLVSAIAAAVHLLTLGSLTLHRQRHNNAVTIVSVTASHSTVQDYPSSRKDSYWDVDPGMGIAKG
jgi:hypothetical protein